MDTRPQRRHTDPDCLQVVERIIVLEKSHQEHLEFIEQIAARQDKYESSIDRLNTGMIKGAASLDALTEKLSHIAPLMDTYRDLQGAGRVIKWLMDNTKVLLIGAGCIALILKADTLLPLVTKVFLGT
jgi:hypothetical protein